MRGMITVLLVAVLGWLAPRAGMAQDFKWYPLSVPEMAAHGATHMAVFEHSDFTETTTNTATSFTNAVGAGIAVEFVKLVLDTAFDLGTDNTNFTGSVILRVGDGSTTDLFLSDTELASEGTEVWAKWPPLTGYAAAITTVVASVTNSYTVLAATGTEKGRKYYSAAGSLVCRFTPNAEHALASNTAGQVRLFFRQTQTKR